MTEQSKHEVKFKRSSLKFSATTLKRIRQRICRIFTVPFREGMTILDGLLYIKENLDASLSFRTSCRMGICGSCGMLINDYPILPAIRR